MDADTLRNAALALPGAYEDFPFGPESSVFKVAAPASAGAARTGKMFAISVLDGNPLKISLKCEPELARQLRLAHPGITGGWHLNKKHWNTADCSVLADRMVLDMLEDSYDLVVSALPRGQREALGWSGLARGR
ncbi:MmcQ/YjbR family DNA-binding protein [Arthrobacter sp. 35W]|uniref:MmcQ/YjbR family DNA-binding protein n=1 Tax=Arthrobacter sp. 35W TaxID=1132441 RepID=UPI0004129FD9|nr:MmcQ/YjbR family DNA-binding protein [Arthrobacter sp. 35W]